MPTVGGHVVLTLTPTCGWPTMGGCYATLNNRFKVIALGHGKSADWVNLASKRAAIPLADIAHLLSRMNTPLANFSDVAVLVDDLLARVRARLKSVRSKSSPCNCVRNAMAARGKANAQSLVLWSPPRTERPAPVISQHRVNSQPSRWVHH